MLSRLSIRRQRSGWHECGDRQQCHTTPQRQ